MGSPHHQKSSVEYHFRAVGWTIILEGSHVLSHKKGECSYNMSNCLLPIRSETLCLHTWVNSPSASPQSTVLKCCLMMVTVNLPIDPLSFSCFYWYYYMFPDIYDMTILFAVMLSLLHYYLPQLPHCIYPYYVVSDAPKDSKDCHTRKVW